MTSEADRQRLLLMARHAIVAHVTGGELTADVFVSESLERHGGAFVTIHRHGELRGCIGHLEATGPLPHVICQCAIAACSSDPRFQPVADVELPDLEIELSLLGPFELISSPAEIEVGRHGLFVERDRLQGLLLPQVATEWEWDRETFLAQTCHKAGLPRDAWRQGARIWRFEAEVFSDARPSSVSSLPKSTRARG
jgi:AmmeMemoRadiSam system protein A